MLDHVYKGWKRVPGALFCSLHPRQCLSFDLGLGWQPANHSDPSVSALHSADVTGTHGHIRVFTWVQGCELSTYPLILPLPLLQMSLLGLLSTRLGRPPSSYSSQSWFLPVMGTVQVSHTHALCCFLSLSLIRHKLGCLFAMAVSEQRPAGLVEAQCK